jgi:hypothetical protein
VIHVLIVISAMVIPALVAMALLVRTWPIKATNTVTKDSSIVLAKMAVRTLAVDRSIEPPADIVRPHLGCAIATPSHVPLKMVE